MKLSELMAAHTPSPTFEGFVTNDDFVLAIDCSADGSAEVKDYAVAQLGVTGLDANLNRSRRTRLISARASPP